MIIFSENKKFFDLNEIVNVVRRALCHQKRALLKTWGARAPSAPLFLRHWTVTPPENKLSENEKIVVDFYIFRLRKFHSPWASVDTYFWKIYNDSQQIVTFVGKYTIHPAPFLSLFATNVSVYS